MHRITPKHIRRELSEPGDLILRQDMIASCCELLMILEYETAEKKCPCLKASLRLGREAAQTCFIVDKYYSE